MFGFSLAELIVVFLIAVIFIKPQDLPEIAHFLGRLYYKIRKLWAELKTQLKEVEKDLGLEEIKSELNRGIAEEKMKATQHAKEITKIVDIYGNEHEVPSEHMPSGLTNEELDEEIKKYNLINKSQDPTIASKVTTDSINNLKPPSNY